MHKLRLYHYIKSLCINRFEFKDVIITKSSDTTEGILRGIFQNFNPLCGRIPLKRILIKSLITNQTHT